MLLKTLALYNCVISRGSKKDADFTWFLFANRYSSSGISGRKLLHLGVA